VDNNLFRFRAFQVDDLARMALHDGGLLGWDPGLYKSGATYVLPWIKGARHVLIVAPEQLHEQIAIEGERFGIRPRPLLTHEDFYNDKILKELSLRKAGTQEAKPTEFNPEKPPLFWITSYSALGFNGGDMWTPKEKDNGEIIVNTTIVERREAHPLYREGGDLNIGVVRNYLTTEDTENAETDYKKNSVNSGSPGAGAPGGEIRCVFYPTLALLTANIFDAVVADESVRMKSDHSYCSLGVRTLTPVYRFPLTATPIKNRLDDIFWLCQWACGGHAEATARWPYPNTIEAKEKFANEHMLIEQNHTREEEHEERTGRFKSFKKRTAKICNIHRLWKLLGPVVLRRRKDDTGEDIVPKTIVPIRVKPGTAQQIVYEFHVANKPKIAKNGNPMMPIAAVVAQLQNLRQAALCPDSPNLSEVGLSMFGLKKLAQERRKAGKEFSDSPLTHKAVLVANKGERTPFQGEREAAFQIIERMVAKGKGKGNGPSGSDSGLGLDIAKILEVAPSLEEKLKPFIVDFNARKHARSWTDFNPKQAAILKLIEQLISKGEQVVVMSPFQQFSVTLYRRLIEANVSACLLDGNVAPAKRGAFAGQFKKKRFAVMVAGIQSMGEGHSFECASNLILPSLEWAFDKNKQAIDRVHRLISKKPVTIYTMVTTNTIDERLESVFREKGDSSNLALDGRLFADKTDEIDLGKLLADAIRDFNPAAETIPEKNIEQEWESSLRQKLRNAEQRFREFHPPIVPDVTGYRGTPKSIAEAVAEANGAGSEIAAIINCIPSATIGALIGSADRAKIDKVRRDFAQFCVAKNVPDWKRGWRMFEASGKVEKL
jgi:hypothetical protein